MILEAKAARSPAAREFYCQSFKPFPLEAFSRGIPSTNPTLGVLLRLEIPEFDSGSCGSFFLWGSHVIKYGVVTFLVVRPLFD